jgi:hypothetical protein
MRVLADNASKILGQPVIVENKPGAGGTLPAQALQTAQPDGYTLAQIPLGVFRLPYTTKINWDPVKDISYVLNVTGYAFGIVVPADSPLKTWTHFVAWAKANPGKLSYGSTGTMTSPHLTMELIAQKLGIELLHVPYKGSADLMQATLGGQLMAAADSTGFAPQVEAGKLRVLNTWGAERLAKFPDAPTLKELGLDIVQNSPFGIGAPKGTPAPWSSACTTPSSRPWSKTATNRPGALRHGAHVHEHSGLPEVCPRDFRTRESAGREAGAGEGAVRNIASSLPESPTATQWSSSPARSRPSRVRTAQTAPVHLSQAFTAPWVWMLLRVVCRPSACSTASMASICAGCSAANSAWSKAMSVSRPAESRARVTPGTSRSTRAAAWRRRCVWACRVAASS